MLSSLLRGKAAELWLNSSNPNILYRYDFGDNWIHQVTLENPDVKECSTPVKSQLIDGCGCCPPEDCGGIYSFMDIREAIQLDPEKAIRILKDVCEGEEMVEDEVDSEIEDDGIELDSEMEEDHIQEGEEDWEEEDEDSESDCRDEGEIDVEEVLEWVRGVGVFFAMKDGKPDFSKINFSSIQKSLSSIELDKIYTYRQKGLAKYQSAVRNM